MDRQANFSGVTPVMEVQRQQQPSTPTVACPLLAVCILALLHGASAGLFPQGSSVLQLTPESFAAELGKARPVLVAFYAPWCACALLSASDLADLRLPASLLSLVCRSRKFNVLKAG